MKNYSLNDENAEQFITNVCASSDGTLIVEFADGKVFQHIEACDENLEKIIAAQEEQAKKGIESYRKFKNRERSSAFKTAVSGLGIAAAGVGATFIPTIHEMVQTNHPALVYTGIGVVAILGTIPAYSKLRKNRQDVEELDKLRYREEHLEDLQNIFSYPNALVGVNPRLAKWILKQDDPFCILFTDKYSLRDLQQIVSNIEVEKTFDFTYKETTK
ncbi:MAG: hypothetical protein IKF71_03200 [Bacilli bacterium]|nr:hypothetical protein [Bacilli bacterium]